MRRMIVRAALLLGIVHLGSWANAQPMPPPHTLPPGVQAPLTLLYPPPSAIRPSAMQVWQYYARDYMGQWRPLVIDAGEYGQFYRYRGVPYYFMRNYPGEYMPYARD